MGKNNQRGGRDDDLDRVLRAQERVYQARELDDHAQREALAREALALDTDCADAYLLLAEDTDDPFDRADLCRQAVDAGWRHLQREGAREAHLLDTPNLPPDLDPAGSPQDAGPYWLRLETRPYMRARFALAEALIDLSLLREGASHFRALLAHDADDHLGARYRLAAILLALDADRDLAQLLDAYATEHIPASFPYTRALLAYRQGERSLAETLIDEALALNAHVPSFLTGARRIPEDLPHSFILGDETEAAAYALDTQKSWAKTPGALPWLKERSAHVTRKAPRAHPPEHAPAAPLATPDEPSPRGAPAAPPLHLVAAPPAAPPHDAPQLSSLPDDPYPDDPYPDDPTTIVSALLTSAFPEGLDRHERIALIDYTIAFWEQFVASETPSIRRPEIYAAAVEYVVSHLTGQTHATQAEIARRYDVAPSSVSRVAQILTAWTDHALTFAPPNADDAEDKGDSSASLLDEETLAELAQLPQSDEHWFGALRPVPFQILEPQPHHPTLAIWYNAHDEIVLSQALYSPTVPPRALTHTLLRAILNPNIGKARLPRAIRIEDTHLAPRLARHLVPLGVSVETGPLDGLQDLMISFERFIRDKTSIASYRGPHIDDDDIAHFFTAAAMLGRAAVWTFVSEGQVIGVDIDHWDLGRVCISVVGAKGYDRGLLIFHNLDDYLRYFRYTAMSDLEGTIADSPVEILSLFFEHGSELEPPQRREIFKHGWEVASPENYPVLLCTDGEGGLLDLDADDYRVATICAEAVARFCERNSPLFLGEGRGPLREEIPLEHGVLDAVHVIAPHPIS